MSIVTRLGASLQHSPRHHNAFVNALQGVPVNAVAWAAAICRDLCRDLSIADFPNPYPGGEEPSDEYLAWDEAFNSDTPAAEYQPVPPDDEEVRQGNQGTGATATILDGTVDEVTAALEDLDVAQLNALLEDETAGKTRKGVVDAINAALDELEAD